MKEGLQEVHGRAYHHIILELNPLRGVYAVGTPTEDASDAQQQLKDFQTTAQGTNIGHVLVDFTQDQGYPIIKTKPDGTEEVKMVIHGTGKHIGGDGLSHPKKKP